jgi:hypothetical protein
MTTAERLAALREHRGEVFGAIVAMLTVPSAAAEIEEIPADELAELVARLASAVSAAVASDAVLEGLLGASGGPVAAG